MKYAILIPDGAADEPVPELEDKTPLEAASIPNMDWISANGRSGRVVTVPSGFLPGSDVATMSLFGHDPAVNYDGRAPLEAVAKGITAEAHELIFRCNFVTIVDGCMEDFTAGHISQPEVNRLIVDLNSELADWPCRFHAGVSYRNLMVGTVPERGELSCTPPHDIPGLNVGDYLPNGPGSEWVRQVMSRGESVLVDHEVNLVRQDMGENPATNIWLWGQGQSREFQSITERFGLRGAAIAAVDLIRGIALLSGLELIEVEGATGYLDTNYAGKGEAAVQALDEYDLVAVHVEAPDEAGHLGDAMEKVKALEAVDKYVVGPVLQKLKEFDEWRILVAPDHPTPVKTRIHSSVPPPFCMAGTGVQSIHHGPFTEAQTMRSDLQIDPGHELLEFFLKSG
ncbi:MAG: cofactor-independent phosphoglycerate mutase [Planctomycetota bacterium]